MKRITSTWCAVLVCAVVMACAQVAAQQGSPATSATTQAQGAESSSARNSQRALPSFLILGTVFNEQSLSFPGVQVRIRRSDERKYRWETSTNSRGEFAVRVFPGYEYEVVTHVKKYQDQKKTVDAKVDVQQRLSIKLEPVEQGKGTAKP